jgi:hypothetical protein
VAANYDLMPNEAILLKQNSVAHGGVLSAYIHELVILINSFLSLKICCK